MPEKPTKPSKMPKSLKSAEPSKTHRPGPPNQVGISRRVLLNDVDAAGVVFYARVMAMAHEAYEEAMAGAGLALDELMRARIGLPLVHAEADFSSPLRHGETVTLRVACTRVGERSVSMRIELAVGPRAAAVVTHVHACVDMDRLASRPIPAEMRAKLLSLS